ncbi:hypothetical protein FQN54_001765 [Arachnomyces sp. PD_36]|nr:hypothetical protein FQN54_001765 [Arachnomyces sp. PD_36]
MDQLGKLPEYQRYLEDGKNGVDFIDFKIKVSTQLPKQHDRQPSLITSNNKEWTVGVEVWRGLLSASRLPRSARKHLVGVHDIKVALRYPGRPSKEDLGNIRRFYQDLLQKSEDKLQHKINKEMADSLPRELEGIDSELENELLGKNEH